MTNLSDYQQVLTPNYGLPPTIIVKGLGCELFGQSGERYLDLAGGIAVSALGHCHPDVVKALTEQANKVWHLSNVLANEPAIELAKALVTATFADRVFFCNSGAEANEAAIKAARKAAFDLHGYEKNEIIAFNDAFHGRTIATVTAGGQPKYRTGFGPMPEGFTHLPFNDCNALEAQISEKTCAVMVELVQGEGGVRPICPTFFEKIRAACDRVGAALIVDEVQTGMGRTGKLFAYQHSDVTPDILSSAKSLGCGFPIGAMLCKEWISEHLVVGTHGSTYGGNPLGTAVAGKALEIINTPELLGNVVACGQQLMDGLNQLNSKHELFKTIRGKGLLIGAVLEDEYSGRAGELSTLTMQEGLMTLVAGPNVHRFAPPLVISGLEIDEALDLLDRAYSKFNKQT
ncbi:MAG: acetylornithine/succinyldiaminopimelate transaminase [Gammaproteobacteria bacterium]